jgi:hypothetical protein
MPNRHVELPKTGYAIEIDGILKSRRHARRGMVLDGHSGFRFVQAAARIGIPIAAVNLGRARADLLALKIEADCETALSFLL